MNKKKENKRTEILYNFVQWQSIKHNLPHFVSKHTSWLLPTYSTVRSPFPYSVELGQKFIRTMVQMKNTKRYSRNYQIYYFWLSNCLYLFEHLMTGCIRPLLLSLSLSFIRLLCKFNKSWCFVIVEFESAIYFLVE